MHSKAQRLSDLGALCLIFEVSREPVINLFEKPAKFAQFVYQFFGGRGNCDMRGHLISVIQVWKLDELAIDTLENKQKVSHYQFFIDWLLVGIWD